MYIFENFVNHVTLFENILTIHVSENFVAVFYLKLYMQYLYLVTHVLEKNFKIGL
jgi:hypothetical protein